MGFELTCQGLLIFATTLKEIAQRGAQDLDLGQRVLLREWERQETLSPILGFACLVSMKKWS